MLVGPLFAGRDDVVLYSTGHRRGARSDQPACQIAARARTGHSSHVSKCEQTALARINSPTPMRAESRTKPGFLGSGEVAEWLKATVLKGVRSRTDESRFVPMKPVLSGFLVQAVLDCLSKSRCVLPGLCANRVQKPDAWQRRCERPVEVSRETSYPDASRMGPRPREVREGDD